MNLCATLFHRLPVRLNTGEKGVIVKVLGHGGFRKRIVEMGFIKGKTVEVLLNAPLRDPIKYKVMGYEISLRRQEAEMIEIISEQEAKEQAVQPDYHEGLGENMHLGEDELKQLALGKRRTINVALVGNPNCGKTSLFNIASGSHEHVGNYSGVRKAGAAISYALGQGATMVAALWGIFIWKEFKGASKSINLLLVFMLILFLSGLGLIIISGGN